MEVNERWLQFGYINAKGNLTKVPFRIPFHTDLEIDQEIPLTIEGKNYVFTCASFQPVTNNDGTVDMTYILITNNQ